MNKRHASVFILLPTVLGIAGAMTINKYTAVGALSVALATVLTYLVPIKSPGLLVKHKPSVMGSTLSLYASMAVLLVHGEALTDGLLGCVRLILMASWLDFVLNASVAIKRPTLHQAREHDTRGAHRGHGTGGSSHGDVCRQCLLRFVIGPCSHRHCGACDCCKHGSDAHSDIQKRKVMAHGRGHHGPHGACRLYHHNNNGCDMLLFRW